MSPLSAMDHPPPSSHYRSTPIVTIHNHNHYHLQPLPSLHRQPPPLRPYLHRRTTITEPSLNVNNHHHRVPPAPSYTETATFVTTNHQNSHKKPPRHPPFHHQQPPNLHCAPPSPNLLPFSHEIITNHPPICATSSFPHTTPSTTRKTSSPSPTPFLPFAKQTTTTPSTTCKTPSPLPTPFLPFAKQTTTTISNHHNHQKRGVETTVRENENRDIA